MKHDLLDKTAENYMGRINLALGIILIARGFLFDAWRFDLGNLVASPTTFDLLFGLILIVNAIGLFRADETTGFPLSIVCIFGFAYKVLVVSILVRHGPYGVWFWCSVVLLALYVYTVVIMNKDSGYADSSMGGIVWTVLALLFVAIALNLAWLYIPGFPRELIAERIDSVTGDVAKAFGVVTGAAGSVGAVLGAIFNRRNLLLAAVAAAGICVLSTASGAFRYYARRKDLLKKAGEKRSGYKINEDALKSIPEEKRTEFMRMALKEIGKKVEDECGYERKLTQFHLHFYRYQFVVDVVVTAGLLAAVAVPLIRPGISVHPLLAFLAFAVAVITLGVRCGVVGLKETVVAAVIAIAAGMLSPVLSAMIPSAVAALAMTVVYLAAGAWALVATLIVFRSETGKAIGFALFDGDEYTVVKEKKPRLPEYHVTGYQCGHCKRSLDRKYSSCPYCGVHFGGTESIYDRPPPGPIHTTTTWSVARSAFRFFLLCLVPPSVIVVGIAFFGRGAGESCLALLAATAVLGLQIVVCRNRTRGKSSRVLIDDGMYTP